MGIQTDATNYDQFMTQMTGALAQMIEENQFEHDWEFQLSYWLPQAVEIACKLKGYKADVEEKRVIYSGCGFASDKNVRMTFPSSEAVKDFSKMLKDKEPLN